MKKILILIIVSLMFAAASYAGTATSGGALLQQEIGARPRGMGGAFTAVADDVSALSWNPAGLVNVGTLELSCMYTYGLGQASYEYLGGALPLNAFSGNEPPVEDRSNKIRAVSKSADKKVTGRGGQRRSESRNKNAAVALSVTALQCGKMETYALDGTLIGEVRAEDDWLVTLGGALPLFDGFSAGLSGKWLTSRLAETATANAFAGDAGVDWQIDVTPRQTAAINKWFQTLGTDVNNWFLTLGAVLQNIGTKIKYRSSGDDMPMTIRGGLSSTIQFDPSVGSLTLAADMAKPNDAKLRFNTGMEFAYMDTYSIRAGYRAGYDIGGFTFGVGVQLYTFQLDYAFSFNSDLNDEHQFTLTRRF